MSDCLFCKIVSKELLSQTVYENEGIIIIKDIKPVAPTHLLVIPKIHINNICDPALLDQSLLVKIFNGIQTVVENLGLKDSGFRVVVNYGRDAGEAVPHFHLHIIAGRQMDWPPG